MKVVTAFVVGFIAATALLLSVALFAQDSPLSLARPLLIDIRQSVPVAADVVLATDSGVITSTLPLTVDVVLQVSVNGIRGNMTPVISVDLGAGNESDLPVDNLGIPYWIKPESDDKLAFVEFRNARTDDGDFELLLVLRKESGSEITSAGATLRIFDKRFGVIKSHSILGLNQGNSYYFKTSSDIPVDKIGSYEIEWKVAK